MEEVEQQNNRLNLTLDRSQYLLSCCARDKHIGPLEKVERHIQAKTAQNKALLMRRLVNSKLKNGISIAEYTSML